MIKHSILIYLILCLTGCVSFGLNVENKNNKPEILDILPTNIDEFNYVGYQVYPEKSLGYSIRYAIVNIGYADVYIYPVPKAALELDSKEIVIESTKAAITDIQYFVSKGIYSEFKVLSQKFSENNGVITTKIEGSFVKNNLQLYTMLYLTEHSGMLLKARISVNDNETNRSSTGWDSFVGKLFGLITANIEKA